jgi:hypothetical protein
MGKGGLAPSRGNTVSKCQKAREGTAWQGVLSHQILYSLSICSNKEGRNEAENRDLVSLYRSYDTTLSVNLIGKRYSLKLFKH